MRRILLFGLYSVLCFCLIGCGSTESVKAGEEQTGKVDENESRTEPGIIGYVVKSENGRILVVSSESKDFSSTGGIKEFYNAIWVSGVSKDVKVGEKVEVWFNGPIMESYPGQGKAEKISVIPSTKPKGATLSEVDAVRLALKKQGNEFKGVPVIKNVQYDNNSNSWNIILKQGETESTIQVEDK